MTRTQECIKDYIFKSAQKRPNIIPIEEDKVKVIYANGKSVKLAMNLYGDIIDADTKKVYAVSRLPHDLFKIGNRLPHSWQEAAEI